jgi:hypothetical protein
MLQFVKAVLPAGEEKFDGQFHLQTEDDVGLSTRGFCAAYFPASQFVHAAGPNESLYFPCTHNAHGPPFGPVYPALQRQLALP